MQHMRLTAVVSRLAPATRGYADILAVAVPALFLAILLPYAWDYAAEEFYIETPALGLPNIVRAAAIPVGAALMLVSCALRIVRFPWKPLLAVVIVLALIAGALFFLTPVLKAVGNWNLVFFFVLLLAAGVLLGVPIGFAFGTATLAFLMCVTKVPLTIVVSRMDEGMSSLVLLAVPLFVFLGLLIDMTGMARAMVAFLAGLLGHVRGGLYYVLLGAMYLVSGISGSKAADMAAVAPVLFPEMKRRGSNDGEMVSILSASGAMSETIPPSLVLITIGSVTGVSIAALFTGGLVPGLVLAIALGVVAWWRSRNEAVGERATGKQIRRTLVIALPSLLLPFVIRSAVVEGVATATEVSTIGIAYATLMGLLVYRQFDWKRLYPMLLETACLGTHAIRLLAPARTGDGERAGRQLRLPDDLDRGLHRAGQRAGRHSRDRAVRAAAVPDRQGRARQRSALCDGRDPGDGRWSVRAATRRRLLRGLRDRPGLAGRRHETDLALSRRARRGTGGGCRHPLVVDWFSLGRLSLASRPQRATARRLYSSSSGVGFRPTATR